MDNNNNNNNNNNNFNFNIHEYAEDSYTPQQAILNSWSEDIKSRAQNLKRILYPEKNEPILPEVKIWKMSVLTTTIFGCALGGLLGSKIVGDKFIYYSRGQVFNSAVDAHRHLHAYAIRGALKMGAILGWKSGYLCGVFMGVQLSMQSYRKKMDVLNYITAGLATGAAYNIHRGVKPIIGGAFVGLLITFPFGIALSLLYLLIPKEERNLSGVFKD